MSEANLDLFFHAPCFDGIASAVLCWDFLEAQGQADVVRLHPVGYDVSDRWLTKSLPRNSAVVDFLFHPDAAFWADHHGTAFLNQSARHRYERGGSGTWIYDHRASSCAALLRRFLRKRFNYRNPKYDTLVDWADRIDSAAYRDVRQAVLAPTAALQIGLTLTGAEPKYCEWLVRQLKARSLSAVTRSQRIQSRLRRIKASQKAGLKHFEKGAHLSDGQIVVFDIDADGTVVNRYAPYYFYPTARYSVGVTRLDEGDKITAMRNPWKRFESVPIGSILARYGGGGHQRIGSVMLKGRARRQASHVVDQVVNEIRERDKARGR